ncbi:MAG: gamma-butyrobetaine hydroxylase-like domain-containing protein [Reyranellaceae bacterium]
MAGTVNSANSGDGPWPAEIRLFKSAARLEIDFTDGSRFAYPAELLRVESPSAEVQGHGGRKTIVAGRRYVKISGVEEVGNYAIRILFDDKHDTGIYSWAYLHELGRRQEQVWNAYLKALSDRGLSRDP